jgi:peptidoglycan/xylan/chitin deacetylase (PgdA/CDA1 family)
VLAFLLLGPAACGGPGHGQQGQWGAAGNASPDATASSSNGGESATDPSPSTAGTPSPGSVAAAIARLPKFATRPVAVPMQLPPGPIAPFLGQLQTTQPVAFLTIDDGWTKQPDFVELFRVARVPVTLFLSVNAISNNPNYFAAFAWAGAVIEAHSLTHPSLPGHPYEFQRNQICGSADRLGQLYGRRPVLFRPPFGNKDQITLATARDCGMKAVLFWKETVDKGTVRYQLGNAVQPGDIILMHFRPRFLDDFVAALQAIARAGLTPALLEDYIA